MSSLQLERCRDSLLERLYLLGGLGATPGVPPDELEEVALKR